MTLWDKVGRILGKASPPPTPQERHMVIQDMAGARHWMELPSRSRSLLLRLKATIPKEE